MGVKLILKYLEVPVPAKLDEMVGVITVPFLRTRSSMVVADVAVPFPVPLNINVLIYPVKGAVSVS